MNRKKADAALLAAVFSALLCLTATAAPYPREIRFPDAQGEPLYKIYVLADAAEIDAIPRQDIVFGGETFSVQDVTAQPADDGVRCTVVYFPRTAEPTQPKPSAPKEMTVERVLFLCAAVELAAALVVSVFGLQKQKKRRLAAAPEEFVYDDIPTGEFCYDDEPEDGEETWEDEIEPLEEESEPPEDEIEPPEDEIEPPPEEDIEPLEDEIVPPEDEIVPPEDESDLPEDEIEPPEEENPIIPPPSEEYDELPEPLFDYPTF